MSFQIWLGFVLACWIISISPGAGAIASMSSGLNYGFRHGYWNALGLQLALLVQIGIVAAGVGGTLCHKALGILGREVVWCGLFVVFGLFTMYGTHPVD